MKPALEGVHSTQEAYLIGKAEMAAQREEWLTAALLSQWRERELQGELFQVRQKLKRDRTFLRWITAVEVVTICILLWLLWEKAQGTC